MKESIHPAPIWVENDADYRDIRADLFIDPQDPGGYGDLFMRFSFPSIGKGLGAGATPYATLMLGTAAIGEIKLTHAQAVMIGAPLNKAAALWRPYYDGERAAPADLESALESAIAHVQALTDARRDGASMVEASVLLEDWAVAAADLLPDPEPDPLQAASDAMLAYDLDDQAWDALPDAARAALIAAVSVPALKAKADAYDRTVAAVKAYDARLSARQRSPEGNDYEELMNRIVPVVV